MVAHKGKQRAPPSGPHPPPAAAALRCCRVNKRTNARGPGAAPGRAPRQRRPDKRGTRSMIDRARPARSAMPLQRPHGAAADGHGEHVRERQARLQHAARGHGLRDQRRRGRQRAHDDAAAHDRAALNSGVRARRPRGKLLLRSMPRRRRHRLDAFRRRSIDAGACCSPSAS